MFYFQTTGASASPSTSTSSPTTSSGSEDLQAENRRLVQNEEAINGVSV